MRYFVDKVDAVILEALRSLGPTGFPALAEVTTLGKFELENRLQRLVDRDLVFIDEDRRPDQDKYQLNSITNNWVLDPTNPTAISCISVLTVDTYTRPTKIEWCAATETLDRFQSSLDALQHSLERFVSSNFSGIRLNHIRDYAQASRRTAPSTPALDPDAWVTPLLKLPLAPDLEPRQKVLEKLSRHAYVFLFEAGKPDSTPHLIFRATGFLGDPLFDGELLEEINGKMVRVF
jgi:hypothetical protein